MVSLGNLFGRFLGGMISDHVGVNCVLLVVLLLDAAAGITLWRTALALVLIAAAGAAGLACGGISGIVPRLAKETLPKDLEAVSGLLFAALATGSFIGPILGSSLGGGPRTWLVLGVISTLGFFLIILRMVHTPDHEQKDELRLRIPTEV